MTLLLLPRENQGPSPWALASPLHFLCILSGGGVLRVQSRLLSTVVLSHAAFSEALLCQLDPCSPVSLPSLSPVACSRSACKHAQASPSS